MAHTFYFGNVAKRKNSTLQGACSAPYDVLFKSPTALDNPTLDLYHEGDFTYNYATYNGNYYFVREKTAQNNNRWEVQLQLDPLATYKSEILASTQFVSYSSQSGGIWLPDTRIPVMKNATVATASTGISILDVDGFYVLSVIGKESAASYKCSLINIKDMLATISSWENNGISNASAIIQAQSGSTTDFGDAISMLNDTLASIGEAMVNTGFIGNAYAAAPSCIRSCIWVPFAYALYEGNSHIWLGNFDTGVDCRRISTKPTKGTSTVNIPWQFSDWRRSVCEEVYLYLPLVGMVNLSSDELVSASSITIDWSATATDGCISYELKADNQIIGTYGGNCSANYPIGISQQASAGEIAQSVIATTDKMVSTGISAASSINPAAWVGGAVSLGLEASVGAYNTANAAMTRHNSCVGGIGGGAGSGLDLDVHCFTVAHPTSVNPADMQATMGVPTMKPMSLSGLTGYCQCANAHVAADADAPILDAIDAYLNGGFYIE